MKIIISKFSGFCMGVKNAFTKSISINDKTETVIFGDIVHNRFAIEEIKNSGLEVISNLESIINNEKIKKVIIRAHGVPPEIEEKLKLSNKTIIDLTCPIVKKVQLLAKEYSSKGYHVLIFGKDNHPEVIGIKGYCSNNCSIISKIEDIEKIQYQYSEKEKLLLISQTTMNSDDFYNISNALSKVFTNLVIMNTLCKNPLKTQIEAINLAKEVDLMLVIGDKNSSNTKSLYERLQLVIKTYFVEDIDDLKNIDFSNVQTIGITGGASTPESQIQKIVFYLESI